MLYGILYVVYCMLYVGVQVGLLVGDMMEKVEQKYLEERGRVAALPPAAPKAPKKKNFAGFM